MAVQSVQRLGAGSSRIELMMCPMDNETMQVVPILFVLKRSRTLLSWLALL